MREREERVSIFPEQEEKICSTQIEGNDSSKEGAKIEVKTTTFIAGLYSPYSTIFEVDFWAQFSRFFWGMDFKVRTVAQKSRQKTEKIKV